MRRSRISAAVVIIVVAGVIAYLALKPSIQLVRPTDCVAGQGPAAFRSVSARLASPP